jgi:hypothetical protein
MRTRLDRLLKSLVTFYYKAGSSVMQYKSRIDLV